MPLYGKRRTDMQILDILLVATSFVLLACAVEFAKVDAASDVKSIPPIYWNTSAPLFKSHNGHVQHVKIGQKIDIICPMRNPNRADESLYFNLFQVSRTNYDTCDTRRQKKLLTCDDPQREKKYTFLFEDITPSPWGLTFRAKETYYFISTSDGTMAGLNNTKGGACTEKNMKLMITVNPRDRENEGAKQKRPVVPEVRPFERVTLSPRYVNTRMPAYEDRNGQIDNGEDSLNGKDTDHEEIVNSNGLVIGVVLGACAVLFIVLLGFLGYKVYRKRRSVKKYQSPGISVASRDGTPQTQVTLLPISSHPGTHVRTHTVRSTHHHHPHLEVQGLPAPPTYNESVLDHAGSTMEV